MRKECGAMCVGRECASGQSPKVHPAGGLEERFEMLETSQVVEMGFGAWP